MIHNDNEFHMINTSSVHSSSQNPMIERDTCGNSECKDQCFDEDIASNRTFTGYEEDDCLKEQQ